MIMPSKLSGFRLLSYKDVLAKIATERCHLLLGNGFSMACDPIFSYPSLYDKAVKAGLSKRAQKVFDRLGTNNFEGVMRLLDDADWVARTYRLLRNKPSGMLKDAEIVKRALVKALGESHLDHTGLVSADRKQAALNFLSSYHSIFTTNYDLLLYWVIMEGEPPSHKDGFAADPDEPELEYLIFSHHLGDQKGIYYLHGALHLYVERGEVRKHSWIRTGKPLISLIRDGLSGEHYPLFMAEGSSDKKLEQILKNGYLSYCRDKLSRIQNQLVIFGHSLGPSDAHIRDIIAGNRNLHSIYLGIHDTARASSADAILSAATEINGLRERRKLPVLKVHYFDSSTADVWAKA
jgi:hypothetical protein